MGRVATAATVAASAWTVVHHRSPAVRRWQRPDQPIGRHGPLSYRCGGPEDAEIGVVLLHGLVATGDVFGIAPTLLGGQHRVLVPDLLGFGRSLDEQRTDFSVAAHLEALEDLITSTLGDRRIRVGAHSMGSALALHWAAAHRDRVDRVVCIGPTIWADPAAARAGLGELGPMGRALALDGRIAQAVCSFNCRHRAIAGLLSAAIAVSWPIPIARQASLHTWPAYRHAVEDLIIDCPWSELLRSLAEASVPVSLIRGADDPVGDPAAIRSLADRFGIETTVVEGDHSLPASHPTLLVDALR